METLETNDNELPTSSSCSYSSKLPMSPSFMTPSTPPQPSSTTRLWRPAAQRNLRNQWSKLAAYKQQWVSTSSSGRSHATSIVNAYLSQSYMHGMELGVLSDMPDIRKRANWKLLKQQELHRRNLLSSYKDLVSIVNQMTCASKTMRCYPKGTSNSSLIQFSSSCEGTNDLGDGGGIPVFTFWTISYAETLAQELVQIFALELNIKRLLVLELLSISYEEVPVADKLCWSNELYPGEFEDLRICNLYCVETSEPLLPKIKTKKAGILDLQSNHKPDQEVLQFYLTTWLAEVNIDTHRIDEMFSIMEEEMHVKLT